MKLRDKFSPLIAFAALAALGGCAEDPYSLALVDLDMSDTAAVARIASSLAPEDQGLFKTYALRHSAQTKFACGNIERHHDGKQPQTIAEALAFTRQWEKEDAARRAAEAKPDLAKMSPAQRHAFEVDELRLAYGELADRKANIEMLRTAEDYKARDDWKKINMELEAAAARIQEKLEQRP